VVHVVVGYIVHHGSCCCGMLNKEQNVFPETCFVFFMVVILSVTTVCQKKRGGGVVAEGYIINIMVFSDVLFWLVILSIVSVYHFKVFVCPRSGPCCSG
jgi:hypothetical protein